MSLGLDGLTDDQLVELLNEACLELAVRDPVVRKLAQGCIRDVAVLMPEIRRVVKGVVGAANAEELGEEEEDDDPPLRHGARRRRNPSARNPQSAFNASTTNGGFMPGSFGVPQNPVPRTQKVVLITVPIGYMNDSLGRVLKNVIGRTVTIYPTANSQVFTTILSEIEIMAAATHPQMAQFHLRFPKP